MTSFVDFCMNNSNLAILSIGVTGLRPESQVGLYMKGDKFPCFSRGTVEILAKAGSTGVLESKNGKLNNVFVLELVVIKRLPESYRVALPLRSSRYVTMLNKTIIHNTNAATTLVTFWFLDLE